MKSLFALLFLILFVAAIGYVFIRTGNAMPLSSIDVTDQPADGPADAPNELIIFSDYLCPACKKYFNEVTLPQLRPIVNSGRLRLVFYSFPIKTGSTEVSRLIKCASQKKNGSIYDLYQHIYGENYEHESANQIAEDLVSSGLTRRGKDDIITCAKSHMTIASVDKDKYQAILHGIGSTPTIVLNRQIVDNAWDIKQIAGNLK